MKESFGRMKRSHRDDGSGKGLVIGLGIGGGLIVLLTLGLVGYAIFGKSRSKHSDDASSGNVLGIDLGTPKLTEAVYHDMKDGATPADLEAILGKGRAPTKDDFDAVFGKPDPNLYMDRLRDQRALWEENTRRGVVWAWRNGELRMMVTFTNPPDQPGRVIAKLLRHADGSVSMGYGSAAPPQPAPDPKQPAKAGPEASAADWNQLVGTWEVVEDPRLRIRFGADKKMGDIFMVNGRQTREKIYTVKSVQNSNGRIVPQLDLGTINGQPNVTPALGVFWFENGTLHRDPGNGKPSQTLKRVG